MHDDIELLYRFVAVGFQIMQIHPEALSHVELIVDLNESAAGYSIRF